ncbi:MAG: DUF167 domain-containing protein [Nitrospirae bacterium]|jgi:uncharacterized protein (TIGR00251 family)|nr:DUF167 domain-containing protein [Nitrospirota bacterium]MCL5061954.1 DUF167 domain-containing protein [Nitrospirota bacterium]MDA8214698.1 DUF167 domain-containing protein [Nitrospiraceae bacterium]MDA8339443.1 DUF167 domain-containing protein [Nitrospiraceae bacterium]
MGSTKEEMDLPHTKVKDGIIIQVKVIPRSSKKEIAGVEDNTIKIKLTAPPVEGAANEQLIDLLSEEFNIKKSSIIILKGESSRHKTVKIVGVNL